MVGLSDTAGALTGTTGYSPYGEPRTPTGQQATVGFQGDPTDATTGLVDMTNRNYDPAMGRFVTQDVLLGDLNAPMSMNQYTYGNGNPVTLFDPLGLKGCITWRSCDTDSDGDYDDGPRWCGMNCRNGEVVNPSNALRGYINYFHPEDAIKAIEPVLVAAIRGVPDRRPRNLTPEDYEVGMGALEGLLGFSTGSEEESREGFSLPWWLEAAGETALRWGALLIPGNPRQSDIPLPNYHAGISSYCGDWRVQGFAEGFTARNVPEMAKGFVEERILKTAASAAQAQLWRGSVTYFWKTGSGGLGNTYIGRGGLALAGSKAAGFASRAVSPVAWTLTGMGTFVDSQCRGIT